MIRRLLPGLMVLAGMLLGSCYPVDERLPRRPARRVNPSPPPAARNEPVITPPRQQPPTATAALPRPQPEAAPARQPTPQAPVKDVAPEVPGRNYPTAQKAPGRDGFVLSPYTSKLILVRGIPSGTVVPDQTNPASPRKFFVVP